MYFNCQVLFFLFWIVVAVYDCSDSDGKEVDKVSDQMQSTSISAGNTLFKYLVMEAIDMSLLAFTFIQ